MPPPALGAGTGGRAQQQAGGVTWSSLLQYSAFPVLSIPALRGAVVGRGCFHPAFPQNLPQVVKVLALKDKISALHLN